MIRIERLALRLPRFSRPIGEPTPASSLVRVTGIAPARPSGHQFLRLAWLLLHHTRVKLILVRVTGIEPAYPSGHGGLNSARIPFRHFRLSEIQAQSIAICN